jgi:hypothetical protein
VTFTITMRVPEARDYEEFKSRFLYRLAKNSAEMLRQASPHHKRMGLKSWWRSVPDYDKDRVDITNDYQRDGFNIATLLHEGTGVYGPWGLEIAPVEKSFLQFFTKDGRHIRKFSVRGIDPHNIGHTTGQMRYDFPEVVQTALDQAFVRSVDEMGDINVNE